MIGKSFACKKNPLQQFQKVLPRGPGLTWVTSDKLGRLNKTDRVCLYLMAAAQQIVALAPGGQISGTTTLAVADGIYSAVPEAWVAG